MIRGSIGSNDIGDTHIKNKCMFRSNKCCASKIQQQKRTCFIPAKLDFTNPKVDAPCLLEEKSGTGSGISVVYQWIDPEGSVNDDNTGTIPAVGGR